MSTKATKKSRTIIPFIFFSCLSMITFSFVSIREADPFSLVEDEKPMISPVNMTKAKIGDAFGTRIHPVTKQNKMHNGIDFLVPEGESVFATAEGIVEEVGSDKNRGFYVTIKHNKTYVTSYSHLKNAVVKTNSRVKKNQLIGYVAGAKKSSSEPSHLHYEVFKLGKNVNPAEYLPKSVTDKIPSKKR